jgi:hypothetical protein
LVEGNNGRESANGTALPSGQPNQHLNSRGSYRGGLASKRRKN